MEGSRKGLGRASEGTMTGQGRTVQGPREGTDPGLGTALPPALVSPTELPTVPVASVSDSLSSRRPTARGPQSVQSVPSVQDENSAPGPPSSQSPSERHPGQVSVQEDVVQIP